WPPGSCVGHLASHPRPVLGFRPDAGQLRCLHAIAYRMGRCSGWHTRPQQHGLTLTYGVLKFPNFSHGALITIGAYVVYVVVNAVPNSAPLRPLSFGWEFLLGLLIAMPITGFVAIICDRIVFRRLRAKKSALVLFAMASLGLAFVLRSLIYLIWGPGFLFYYHGRSNPALHLLWGIDVQADQLFAMALALALMFFLYLLIKHTKMGKAMRATADNPDLAK